MLKRDLSKYGELDLVTLKTRLQLNQTITELDRLLEVPITKNYKQVNKTVIRKAATQLSNRRLYEKT